jgi:hypothetical protein
MLVFCIQKQMQIKYLIDGNGEGIKQPLAFLDMKGSAARIDAIGCQKEIVTQIFELKVALAS